MCCLFPLDGVLQVNIRKLLRKKALCGLYIVSSELAGIIVLAIVDSAVVSSHCKLGSCY